MGFRLIPTSMILNDLQRRNSPYFAFFSANSIALLANYATVVEDRPVGLMSVKYWVSGIADCFRSAISLI